MFTAAERATIVTVSESPTCCYRTTLGDIADANPFEADVLQALRAILDGAPTASVLGFVGISFEYRLAHGKAA